MSYISHSFLLAEWPGGVHKHSMLALNVYESFILSHLQFYSREWCEVPTRRRQENLDGASLHFCLGK